MTNTSGLVPFKEGDDPRRNLRGNYNNVPHSKTRLLKILNLIQKKENELTGENEDLSIAEQMDLKIIARALSGDVKAYKEIIDRLEGTPIQTVNQKVVTETDIPITKWIEGGDQKTLEETNDRAE